jgi:phosphocarrier protein
LVARRRATVVNRLGLHARPFTRLVEIANRFRSGIVVRTADGRADAKSVLSLMGLAAPQGTEMEIEASGEDEQAAAEALAAEIAGGFGE